MPSLYERIGEATLRILVENFYDEIEENSAAEALHLLHIRGHGVQHSRIEQFNFLSGFFGGPKLYIEKFGHSNLKKIHEHMDIDTPLRELWLECMSRAIERTNLSSDTATEIMSFLTKAARTIGTDNPDHPVSRNG